MLSPVLSGFWEQSQTPGEQSDGIQTQRLPRIPSVSTLGRAATPFVSLQMSSEQTTNLCMEQMYAWWPVCREGIWVRP